MICFALIAALPAKGVGKPNNASSAALQATDEADACSVQHEVPGTVLSDQFLLDTPDRAGLPLIKLIKTDIIEVLGKNSTGFWIAARSNYGIVGWVDSTQVQVDKKQWSNPKIVPVVEELPESDVSSDTSSDNSGDNAEATDEPGDSGNTDAQATENPYANCLTIAGLVTADRFALQIKPLTKSGDAGETVTRNAKITILALNPSGSWALVRTEGGVEGWMTTAYTLPLGAGGKARMGKLRNDYGVVEATLTPSAP